MRKDKYTKSRFRYSTHTKFEFYTKEQFRFADFEMHELLLPMYLADYDKDDDLMEKELKDFEGYDKVDEKFKELDEILGSMLYK